MFRVRLASEYIGHCGVFSLLKGNVIFHACVFCILHCTILKFVWCIQSSMCLQIILSYDVGRIRYQFVLFVLIKKLQYCSVAAFFFFFFFLINTQKYQGWQLLAHKHDQLFIINAQKIYMESSQ
jgi:hypothetical protein